MFPLRFYREETETELMKQLRVDSRHWSKTPAAILTQNGPITFHERRDLFKHVGVATFGVDVDRSGGELGEELRKKQDFSGFVLVTPHQRRVGRRFRHPQGPTERNNTVLLLLLLLLLLFCCCCSFCGGR